MTDDTDTLGLRQRWLSRPLLAWYRKVAPQLSPTEQEALQAGTVGWEGIFLTGKPAWAQLLQGPDSPLTQREQAFLDGPTAELCGMLDDWAINNVDYDLPPEVWRFIREKGFFGLIIPEAHGGHGFSAAAHSAVIKKIATRSTTAAVTVMVPNSLGPAELLLEYGTPEQQQHYLPRLARGEEIPCFGLTGPLAGSDAGAMPDSGRVEWGTYQGEQVLGVRVDFDKRYITLAPVATVVGLAFKLEDPDGLLGGTGQPGPTVALLPADTPGLEIGERHYPAYQAFMNGPVRGRGVFVPMSWIPGGQAYAGHGWSMLMECLAAGRGISLPALGTGGLQLAARASGAYARVRQQFGRPVGQFEGVAEALARIGARAYLLESARRLTCAAIDDGEKPSVASAIMKYHATERLRAGINDAMDIHGGKAICAGPKNYLASVYTALPVAITVEGANILTRSMIVFGQGAIRCHPWLLKEIEAAALSDESAAVKAFDTALWGHVRHIVANIGRSLGHNLTRGRFAAAPRGVGKQAHWYRQLSRMSASFAVTADAALGSLGGALKRKESLSARLGDVLSELYLLSAALKRFHRDGYPAADQAYVDWLMADGLARMQASLAGVLANLPNRPLAWALRPIVLPFGQTFAPPKDKLTTRIAEVLMTPGVARDRLAEGIDITADTAGELGRLELALTRRVAAEPVAAKLRDAEKAGTIAHRDDIAAAQAAGVISESDAAALAAADEAMRDVIAVDSFPAEAFKPSRKRASAA